MPYILYIICTYIYFVIEVVCFKTRAWLKPIEREPGLYLYRNHLPIFLLQPTKIPFFKKKSKFHCNEKRVFGNHLEPISFCWAALFVIRYTYTYTACASHDNNIKTLEKTNNDTPATVEAATINTSKLFPFLQINFHMMIVTWCIGRYEMAQSGSE